MRAHSHHLMNVTLLGSDLHTYAIENPCTNLILVCAGHYDGAVAPYSSQHCWARKCKDAYVHSRSHKEVVMSDLTLLFFCDLHSSYAKQFRPMQNRLYDFPTCTPKLECMICRSWIRAPTGPWVPDPFTSLGPDFAATKFESPARHLASTSSIRTVM